MAPLSQAEENALKSAISEASRFVGATAPNPPVGASGLDGDGNLLGVRAHERAGQGHAEANLLADLEKSGLLPKLATLVVTLEPCNHHGRTPPCTEAILRAAKLGALRRVIYAEGDPNPAVAGGGGARLSQAGLEVVAFSTEASRELLAPFAHRCRTGRPFATIKIVRDAKGSMIPPPGQKTFSQESSLVFAHELRRRADALLTGSGTVLADRPLFNVRRVPDHPGKTRTLVVLDRRGRTPDDWIQARRRDGWDVWIRSDFDQAMEELGKSGVLEVLIEAGPELTDVLLAKPHALQKRVEIRVREGSPDEIRVV